MHVCEHDNVQKVFTIDDPCEKYVIGHCYKKCIHFHTNRTANLHFFTEHIGISRMEPVIQNSSPESFPAVPTSISVHNGCDYYSKLAKFSMLASTGLKFSTRSTLEVPHCNLYSYRVLY